MDNKKGFLSKLFSAEAAKGAAVGAGVTALAAVALPVVAVSAPVVVIGAAVGAIIGASNKK